MQISLAGQNALVGAASDGLGKAIAIELARSGANVTIMSRTESKLKKVLKELDTNANQRHQYIVINFENLPAFKKKLQEYFKKNEVNILVNNTNGPKPGTASDVNEKDYQSAFELLFQTVAYATNLALKKMKLRQYGRIINLTSSSVQEPIETLVLSNTFRSGLAAWAKTLATAVAKDGITVNNILTGNFNTNRMTQLFSKQAASSKLSIETIRKQKEKSIPVQRMGEPEEMGWLVTFLASDKAAYITGTNITIDGGAMKSL